MEWGGLFFVGLIAFVCSLILILALVVFWFDSRPYLPKDNQGKAEEKGKFKGRVPGQL